MKTIHEFLLKNKTAISTQDTDYIDLGLPSGLLWARCNIGAEKPTDYGDYFMWGSTEPNTNDECFWDIAPFNGGYDEFNEKYFDSLKNKVCPNNILADRFDAVSVLLGNGWRMPTKEDFKELFNNAEHKWVKDYQNSNINGILFTSKNGGTKDDGTNDGLFIPASGYRPVFSLSKFAFRNSVASLWSSSICSTAFTYAWALDISSKSLEIDTLTRFRALCLRGVLR